MGLTKDDSIAITPSMHQELSSTMGKNFNLYTQAANVRKASNRSGDLGSTSASAAGSLTAHKPYKHKPAFPPLMTNFTLRQTKQAPPRDIKPIRMTRSLRDELVNVVGDKNVRMIEKDVGFVDKPAHQIQQISEDPPPVFNTVFGARQPRPQYEFTSKPHATKINGKFYWPNQTNSEAHIPVTVKLPPEVRDLKSWLKVYGEPTPDRVPTGFLTTMKKSHKRVGKNVSQGVTMVREATGKEWKRQLDESRKLAQTSHF